MKEKTIDRVIDLICGGILGVGLSLGAFFIHEDFEKQNIHEKAKAAATELYEPIGNAGSFQAFHGKITPRRLEMYEQMHEAYIAEMRKNGYDVNKSPYSGYLRRC